MKQLWKKLKATSLKAFTLAEMLVVLLIISVLILLFVPNLTKQKEVIQEKGSAAIVKVVESQLQLYELENGKSATVAELASAGYITDKQLETYNDYQAKK